MVQDATIERAPTDATDAASGADSASGPAAFPALDPARAGPMLEAMLVSLERPTTAAKLGEALSGVLGQPVDAQAVESLIAVLNESFAHTGRAFRAERVAGGWRLMTLAEHAPAVAALHRAKAGTRLSRPAIETLSIIAYRQPITRAELEAIRGVACGEVLKSLLDRRLVAVVGRAEELGRPMLYGTTRQFLDLFGLASLSDLPKPDEPRAAAEALAERDGSEQEHA
jgi:segregation and condensation protein B